MTTAVLLVTDRVPQVRPIEGIRAGRKRKTLPALKENASAKVSFTSRWNFLLCS